jgi:lipid II:glycine glycyltransferase (peptidoglycan interpeptide bridge formation enzyme)
MGAKGTPMPRLTPEEQITRAAQQKAKAEETIRRAQKALRDTERKKDTRRKVILGAALLDAAERNENVARFLASIVIRLERPADRAVFDRFDLPRPKD